MARWKRFRPRARRHAHGVARGGGALAAARAARAAARGVRGRRRRPGACPPVPARVPRPHRGDRRGGVAGARRVRRCCGSDSTRSSSSRSRWRVPSSSATGGRSTSRPTRCRRGSVCSTTRASCSGTRLGVTEEERELDPADPGGGPVRALPVAHLGAERPGRRAAVSEVRPPKLQADELTTLCALLQYTRESLVRKVDGVSEQDARRSLVGSDTTLLWLVKHVRMAETLWMCVRFADDGAVVPEDAVLDGDTVADAVAAYRATWASRRRDRVVGGIARRCVPWSGCRRPAGEPALGARAPARGDRPPRRSRRHPPRAPRRFDRAVAAQN